MLMASRGRPLNPLRAPARQAGVRYYVDEAPCDMCGNNKRYVSNANCVFCAISRGSARYAGLDEAAKAAVKARDHERYVKRMTEAEAELEVTRKHVESPE